MLNIVLMPVGVETIFYCLVISVTIRFNLLLMVCYFESKVHNANLFLLI